MDKQIVVYADNGVLLIFCHKMEWNIDTCYNMDESKKHSPKRNKPYIKSDMLCDHIYVKDSEWVKPWKQKADWWLQGVVERDWR